MNLDEIKKRFEESLSDNAIDTMKNLVLLEDMSPENQELLFNYRFKRIPSLNDDEFYNFVSGLNIGSPDEDYNELEDRDCTRSQFFLRKILIAVAIENVQNSVDSIVEDIIPGYYDYYFIEPSSPYNGNRLFAHNSEVIEAIQEIIDTQKK